jgi:hypothetical protein
MGSKIDRSTKIQLWIIFGLFIGIILGMIGYEINKVFQARQQKENFEKIRKFETRHLNKHVNEEEKKADTSSIQPLNPEE